MDAEIIRAFGQTAGIGGLALGVFLFIAKDLIRKAVFPALTKQQSSRVILILAFMAWRAALAGIASWTYTSVFPRINQAEKSYTGFPTSEEDKQTNS